MARIEAWTDKLAELAVFGANVQPGQLVAITSYVGKEQLTRRVARAAYQRGAKYVDVLYFDQWLKRERIAHAPEDTLDFVPPWMRERLFYLSDEHAARVREEATAEASETIEEGLRRRAQIDDEIKELEARRDAALEKLERLKGELEATMEGHRPVVSSSQGTLT